MDGKIMTETTENDRIINLLLNMTQIINVETNSVDDPFSNVKIFLTKDTLERLNQWKQEASYISVEDVGKSFMGYEIISNDNVAANSILIGRQYRLPALGPNTKKNQ